MNPPIVKEVPIRLESAGQDPFIADLPSGTEPGRAAAGAERSTASTDYRNGGTR